jgi:uncharacterized protein with NRDE domain
MCLALIALDSHPDYRLIVAANRDEFYDGPTAPAAFWADAPSVLARRDLKAGGTWLGVDRRGRDENRLRRALEGWCVRPDR